MGRRGIIYYIFQRPRFCCCLPVRVCVIISSVLGILLAGVLSIVLWYEVSRAEDLTKKERASFAGGAIVETLFFLISVVGLIGAIVRKLTFATAYAIGLYVHFLINLSVAAYLLFIILHATRTDTVALCQHAIKNAQAQSQCGSLFSAIRGLYAGLASFVLLVELYGAIIATRYVYQLRGEKREARLPRHLRAESTSSSGRLMPGFVRYRDANGATVYNSYYYPPTADHAHDPSAYSLGHSEFEGGTPMGLYDPPSATLSERTYFENPVFEYKDDNHGDGYRDHDHDHDHVLEPPPGLEGEREAVEGERGYVSESPR